MAGQGIERRDVMRLLAMAAAASGFPGFRLWSFACAEQAAVSAKPSGDDYQPLFFSAAEYATLQSLTERIIPTDDTAGAREAGVSEFIDFMVAHDTEVQHRFRYGLAWLDAHSLRLLGCPFQQLPESSQIQILEPLAYTRRYRPGEEDGRLFFRLIRDYTLMGFYTSRVGLEQLDYPGLKLYSESPGCPDPSDPQHRHAER